MLPARVARTSKYSASTLVVPSVAVLYSVHNDSNCAARAACPASSSRENAVCVGPKYWRKNSTTSFGMNGYLNCAFCRTKFRVEVLLENLWRTVCSSPQSTGGGTKGERGTILAVTCNDFPTKPSGVQFAMAINPPGLHTLTNSAATRSGRGANMAPNMVSTTSNECSE